MSTGVNVLDSTVQKTIELLNDVCEEFEWGEGRRQQAYSALRSVLHAVRDRLVVTEAANLAAQLPMLVRGLYYESWKPESAPRKMHREEFLSEVQRHFLYSVEGGPERLLEGVLRVLSRHIDPGTLQKAKQELPGDLRPLFDKAA